MMKINRWIWLFALCCLHTVGAQVTPEGLWATYNDQHTQVQSWVRIEKQGEFWIGRIEKILDPSARPDEKCNACQGEKQGLPLLGLTIIDKVAIPTGSGGTILDPEDGKIYRLELSLIQDGRELRVRGYWGPFWRTQRWLRVSQ
jgi:hypothetical protein